MANYYCSCRKPARFFISRIPTRKWHGKKALEDHSDLDYACCTIHLTDAIEFLTGGTEDVMLRMRAVKQDV